MTGGRTPESSLDASLRGWLASAIGFAVYRIRIPGDGLDAEVDLVSPSLRDVLGVEPDALFSSWFDGLDPDERERIGERSTQAALAEQPFEAVMRIRHPDHEGWRWVHAISHPVREGGALFFNGLIIDVTDIKEAEERARALERKLDDASRLETVGLLAAGIAHDLNNGLMVIGSRLELARGAVAGNEYADHNLELAQRQVDEAAELTAQLLGYAGKSNFRSEHTDLVAVFGSVVDTLRRTHQHVRTTFVAPAEAVVLADSSQIERVATNVLLNAFEAMNDVGAVEVEVATAGGIHWVEVRDDGPGMTDDVLRHAFDPFFTTKTGTRQRAAGLGLASSKGIVEASGGSIFARSTPGEGTTLRIEFPVAVPGSLGGEPPAVAPAGTGRRSLEVLVVDDEEAVRRALDGLLTMLGHRPTALDSGDAAVAVLEGAAPGAFDVALVDIVMPGLAGTELLRTIRRVAPELRVVVCTGFTERLAEDAGFDPTEFPLLRKPFTSSQLRAILDAT